MVSLNKIKVISILTARKEKEPPLKYSGPSLFKIFWPVAEVQKRDETRIDTQIQFQTRTETILFVEDDKDVRNLASQALNTFGYNVIEAENGRQALDIITKDSLIDKIDLVISDIVMPEMDGEELAENLREINPDIKILLCSGFTDSRVAMRESKNRKGQLKI
jgi:CheY-like chemotaxis protein